MVYQQEGLSPGDHGDPVADSIRAQQATDAMPSQKEAHGHDQCEQCGEKSADVEHRKLNQSSCSARESPPRSYVTLCTDCDDERQSLREQYRQNAQRQLESENRDDPVAIVIYECGEAKTVSESDRDRPAHPMSFSPESAPIKCRCGDPIDDIIYPHPDGSFQQQT